jgi:hypothetical protein
MIMTGSHVAAPDSAASTLLKRPGSGKRCRRLSDPERRSSYRRTLSRRLSRSRSKQGYRHGIPLPQEWRACPLKPPESAKAFVPDPSAHSSLRSLQRSTPPRSGGKPLPPGNEVAAAAQSPPPRCRPPVRTPGSDILEVGVNPVDREKFVLSGKDCGKIFHTEITKICCTTGKSSGTQS